MKLFSKSAVKRLLFKNLDLKDYFAVRIAAGRPEEKVWLKNGNSRLDISEKHCVACEKPFCIAVLVSAGEFHQFSSGKPELVITNGTRISTWLALSLEWQTEEDEHVIALFEIEKVKCYQLSQFKQYILLKYYLGKGKLSYRERKIYGALYSYPRSVVVVSYKEEGYYNIFPMDFQCYVAGRNRYMLGLRTTNITVEKILRAKKVVISDTDTIDISTIYALGRHHSGEPPGINELPFHTTDSERFKFPVPAFSASYREIELTGHYRTGSHLLLIGKVVNTKEIRKGSSPLYHIHFFQSTQSHYLLQF